MGICRLVKDGRRDSPIHNADDDIKKVVLCVGDLICEFDSRVETVCKGHKVDQLGLCE